MEGKMNEELEYLNREHDLYTPVLERVEWHCQGRHGVIRNVEKKDEQLVSRTITYFFGNKGQWWKKNRNKTMDVEFVPMTKVFPPPRKPWEWCGKTILFEDWQKQEKENRDLSRKFKIGQSVSFTHKDKIYTGIVSGLNKRAKVVIPGEETWWNVPYTDLRVV
jgi:hypothetical protein